MTTKQFIEKAIEGGWNNQSHPPLLDSRGEPFAYALEILVLDPLAERRGMERAVRELTDKTIPMQDSGDYRLVNDFLEEYAQSHGIDLGGKSN